MADAALKPCCEATRAEMLEHIREFYTSFPVIRDVPCRACHQIIKLRVYERPAPAALQTPGALPPGAEPLGVDQLLGYDIFADIPRDAIVKHLERYEEQPPVWRRRFKAGDLICREGEYGSTAFYIVSGSVDVFLAAQLAHAKSDKREGAGSGWFGLIRTFTTALVPTRTDARDEDVARRWIPIDADLHLDYDHPVGQLGTGDLFGEMTCLSFYPRSATVRAAGDCEVIEMLRSVLQDLLQRRSQAFRARMEDNYRRRALDTHLRSVPVFADLTDAFLDHLRGRVELRSCEPGEVICRQGDAADNLYLIRLGFVKVSQHHPGGELVLSYLGRGQYFGEMGLLAARTRTSTCTALDHVELVRIGKDDFDLMVARFPEIKQRLATEADARQRASRLMAEAAPEVPLDHFLEQGLMDAQNVLLIDLDKCTRCDECVRACAAAHDGVTRLLREGLRYDKYLVATSCRQCTDPLCMIGCPVGSIRRRETLEIIIEDWCIGCGKCANQCPYGNINMHEFPAAGSSATNPEPPSPEKKALTCDLCLGLSEPSCVYACPHDAAIRVEPKRFFAPQLYRANASREAAPR
ncbi:MAG TPA: cyclic nucleotide-binding domain-containing protein [Candidatus Kryptonia bacterium]|nr:cyclic nucleotide-binding domain-containing protein [Candidatus Kryptonia bacterium]